jgi:hypothetical protein
MSSYSIISDFSEKIVAILREALVPDLVKNENHIAIVSPEDKGDKAVGLYIYGVNENNVDRINDMLVISEKLSQFPPIGLKVNFMITRYGNGSGSSKAMQEYNLMGRIIQVLQDNNVIDSLGGDYDNLGNPVIITRLNIEIDEQIKLWGLFNEPYRLTIFYEASTLYIESEKIVETSRVREAKFNVRRK